MKLRLTILALIFSVNVQAEEIVDAKIKRLMLDRSYGGQLFIELDRHQSNPVECHGTTAWQFILDVSDDLGKQMYASLLAWHTSGKVATFKGNDLCSLHESIETLHRVELK